MKKLFLLFLIIAYLICCRGIGINPQRRVGPQQDHVFVRKASARSIISFEEVTFGSNEKVSSTLIDEMGEIIVPSVQSSDHFLIKLTKKLPNMPTLHSLQSLVTSVFLPEGFPATVPPEYLHFQSWNCFQDLCSYLRNVMAMRAVLDGMGVGRSDMTSAAAALQWILKDGASMLGGLLFTSLSSGKLGQNLKIWRLFADTINNVGITLEMIAPLLPRQYFLMILCLASICKSLCGIAAGATGAGISEHWGNLYNNAADVASKNSAQHTIVSLLGLCVSLKFSDYCNKSPTRQFLLYGVLTACHMFANYRAMRILSLRSLNLSRFELLVENLFSVIGFDDVDSGVRPIGSQTMIQTALNDNADKFTQAHIAKIEPILSLIFPRRWRKPFFHLYKSQYDVEMWSPPSQLLLQSPSGRHIVDQFKASSSSGITKSLVCPQYIIQFNEKQKRIHVFFSSTVSAEDQARAYLEALVLSRSRTKDTKEAQLISNVLFPPFFQFLRANGWDTQRLLLRPSTSTAFQIRWIQ